jgi:hypothetical protein
MLSHHVNIFVFVFALVSQSDAAYVSDSYQHISLTLKGICSNSIRILIDQNSYASISMNLNGANQSRYSLIKCPV